MMKLIDNDVREVLREPLRQWWLKKGRFWLLGWLGMIISYCILRIVFLYSGVSQFDSRDSVIWVLLLFGLISTLVNLTITLAWIQYMLLISGTIRSLATVLPKSGHYFIARTNMMLMLLPILVIVPARLLAGNIHEGSRHPCIGSHWRIHESIFANWLSQVYIDS